MFVISNLLHLIAENAGGLIMSTQKTLKGQIRQELMDVVKKRKLL